MGSGHERKTCHYVEGWDWSMGNKLDLPRKGRKIGSIRPTQWSLYENQTLKFGWVSGLTILGWPSVCILPQIDAWRMILPRGHRHLRFGTLPGLDSSLCISFFGGFRFVSFCCSKTITISIILSWVPQAFLAKYLTYGWSWEPTNLLSACWKWAWTWAFLTLQLISGVLLQNWLSEELYP